MKKQLGLVALSVISLSLPFNAAYAQTADCAIDVQPIVATLIEAQTAAASGDQDAALQQLADAKTAIETLEAGCTAEPLPPPELSETFTAPDDSFTFSYPAGWVAGQFVLTLDSFGNGGRAIIGSNETALDMLTQTIDNTKLEPEEQAAMIIAGSPSTVLYSLGIYDSTVEQPDLSTLEALTDYIQLAIKDGPLFKEIADPVYEGQTASFTIADTEFDGMVLVSQLDTDKFAFTLLIGDTGTQAAVNSVAQAIHSTIQ
ncbi:MAG: hypothetical protein LCI00_17725 [Chloroflexi bacterium]|nr:hypothetical protein [Chloroflexota bacterium]MCC6893816.1 hypothetical protein [Anaerolineae bacterium]